MKCWWIFGHLWTKWEVVGTAEIWRDYTFTVGKELHVGRALHQERQCERCGYKQARIEKARL